MRIQSEEKKKNVVLFSSLNKINSVTKSYFVDGVAVDCVKAI